MNKSINKLKSKGFTIVELLVVIVVIGILAAITIISYTGVSARANTANAQSMANAAAQVADSLNLDNGYYPASVAIFNAGSTSVKMPNGVTAVAGLAGSSVPITGTDPLNSTTGKTKVTWACNTNSCASATGGRITYFDFTAATSLGSATVASQSIVYVGSAKAGDTFFAAP